MRSLLVTGMSFMLTSFVLGNAFYQKKQFYPSVVYITKSNPSMAIIYIQALVFVVMTGKMLRKVFFGQLRAAEVEHLVERSWYAVTETCLAFTVFRDEFTPRFVALFTLLLFLKCFHWLAEDRIDYMERSPAISWRFHLRAISLMLLLGLLDALFIRHAFYSIILKGPSVQLVFGFEYEILLTVVVMMFIKYVAHSIDLQSENPWDNKAIYLLYSELIIGFVRVVLYIIFMIVMIRVHTFPLFAIRPMYLTLRAFQKAASDVVLSRRAIRHMNTLYPDATPEELSSGDNSCIICREEMTTGCKKLPCNHIFHTTCLRSWFQRQQTCPTCRLQVLRAPRPANQQQQQQQQQQQAAPQQQPQQQQPPQFPNQPPAFGNPFNNGMFGGLAYPWAPNAAGAGMVPPPPFGWPPQQPMQQPGAAAPATSNAASGGTTSTTTAAPSSASPGAQTQSQSQSQPAGGSSTTSSSSGPTTATSTTPTAVGNGSIPVPPMPTMGMGMGMGMPPPPFLGGMPPPMMGPYGFPVPPNPMEGLSEDELRAMEGMERANVEARIHWLRDIQALLDGAMLLIGQYNAVASHMGSPGINTAPPPPQTYSTAKATSSSSSSSSPSTSISSSSTTTAAAQSSYQLPQPRWWPAEQGARPKYTSTHSKTHTSSSTDSDKRPRTSSLSLNGDAKASDELEGASGYTPPKEEMIPSWESPSQEEHENSMHEIRKRRLQHFKHQPGEESSQHGSDGAEDAASGNS